jgi:hypothetical protein
VTWASSILAQTVPSPTRPAPPTKEPKEH